MKRISGRSNYFWWCTLLVTALGSCKSHQHIMFQTDDDFVQLAAVVNQTKANYPVMPHDRLEIKVFTNRGERLIDPDQTTETAANITNREAVRFEVDAEGLVTLPVIGEVSVAGLTLTEVNDLLEEKYSLYYKGPYVQTQFQNKRVVVLGGAEAKVVPLQNEGTSLLEVLALAGGVGSESKVHNIRLIRGELSNPEVHIIDLSTVDGLKRSNLMVQPNDVIYVEPRKQPVSETLRTITPFLGVLTSILAIIIAVNR